MISQVYRSCVCGAIAPRCTVQPVIFLAKRTLSTAAEQLLQMHCIALCIAAAHLSLNMSSVTAAECAMHVLCIVLVNLSLHQGKSTAAEQVLLQVLCIALCISAAHVSLYKSSVLHDCQTGVFEQTSCLRYQ